VPKLQILDMSLLQTATRFQKQHVLVARATPGECSYSWRPLQHRPQLLRLPLRVLAQQCQPHQL
jgi:hypothetical protein